LDVEDDSLVLWIQDDGCGFDVAHMRARALAGGSVGVLGMQERAELIGGKLVIESAPNHGSTVRLRCPLRTRTDVS
jgi:two-component system sensor histidine kinase UhpB